MSYTKILKNIEPRIYQKDIYESCKNDNCLVVLPTGTGKTLISLMLAIDRLNQYPNSKILFLAPTKPLADQQMEYFKKSLPLNFARFQLFTGKVNAIKRKELWKEANIIFSTPQCIENDLKKQIYTLTDVSLLVEDEAHKCLKNYSYTYVAQEYLKQGLNQRILGMTASPGVEKKTIALIMTNLNMNKIEVRTRDSPDVKQYMQDLNYQKVMVDFPEAFNDIKVLLKTAFDRKIKELRFFGFMTGPPMKRLIIEEQQKIKKLINSGKRDFHLYSCVSICSQCIRLDHAIELLECQSILTFNDFIQDTIKLAGEQKSKAVQVIVNMPEFSQITSMLKSMIDQGIEHPKMNKLKEIILSHQRDNPDFKALVFSQFRTTTGAVAECLNKNGILAAQFVGQSKKTTTFGDSGSNQKEQKQIVEDFKSGKIKVLACTSIAEEGLDIPEVGAVIFFEPVPSAIRKIQRAGRTARLHKGSLYILVARGTRDEGYYYSAVGKEKKMYTSIHAINEDLSKDVSPFAKYEEKKEEVPDPSKWEEVGTQR